MYCIKCGIKLGEGQSACPACNTRVCHPDFPVDPDRSPYPVEPFKSEEYSRVAIMFVTTVIMAMAAVLPLIYEITQKGEIVWSGYSTGGVTLLYITVFLPLWFRRPNPAIFVPSAFAAASLYLLYICYATGGHWYLTFALPVSAVLGVIVTATTVLTKYLRHGKMYIFGGLFIALGLFVSMIETFLHITFDFERFIFWSMIPLIAFCLFGLTLIVIAIVKPFKRSFEKIFNV